MIARACRLLTVLLFIVAFSQPHFLLAQDATPDAGIPVDESTAQSAIAFVEDFVQRMNAHDSSIVNVANETGLAFFLTGSYAEALDNVASGEVIIKINLLESGNVLIYPDNRISIDVTFTGYTRGYQSTLQSERWYMIPADDGSLILDNYAYLPVQVPAGMESTTIHLSVSKDGLEMEPVTIEGTGAVLFEVTNLEPDRWASTGIYQLQAGMDPEKAQSMVAEDYTAIPYYGKTPVRPGESGTFAFILPAGETYLIQQFLISLDATKIEDVPLGAERFRTLEIGF